MPVISVNTCTQEAVLAALLTRGRSASYDTDNNEALAEVLGFDRNQVNIMFGHLRRLTDAGHVSRVCKDVEPERTHPQGSRMVPVRRVTYTLV